MGTDKSVAFTEENLAALEKSLVEGVQRVKYTDKEVEYRSLDEMLKIRKLMRNKLGKKRCGNPGLFGGKRVNAIHSKGFEEDC